ncbi:hypothetical protein N9H93_01615 [Rhizobiaceae bacterium]|nr:hypothetical protein [Rhizobiaceae bacterium]
MHIKRWILLVGLACAIALGGFQSAIASPGKTMSASVLFADAIQPANQQLGEAAEECCDPARSQLSPCSPDLPAVMSELAATGVKGTDRPTLYHSTRGAGTSPTAMLDPPRA